MLLPFAVTPSAGRSQRKISLSNDYHRSSTNTMLHKETTAAQPSSVDASVRLLMARMHGIDTRRQITMMHVKECQAKVAFEKGAADTLARENAQLVDREAALRQALQNLVDEQRELQVRHEGSKRAHATAETEEPLLMNSAQASLKDAQQEQSSWQKRVEEVQAMHAKWQGDVAGSNGNRGAGAAARLMSHAEKLETELQDLLKEEQELVVQLKALSSAASSTVPSAAGGATAEHAHPLPHTIQLEVDQLNAELQLVIKEAEDLELQHQRQMSILGREVKDLGSRLVDVEQWAIDSRTTTLELESSVAEMQRVLSAGRCTACLG